MLSLKDQIYRELDYVLNDNVLGFISITVEKLESGKPSTTVTFLSSRGLKGQEETLDRKFFELADILEIVFTP